MADGFGGGELRAAWEEAMRNYERATGTILATTAHTFEDLKAKCADLQKPEKGDLVISSAKCVLDVASVAVSTSPAGPVASAVLTALSSLVDTVDFYRNNFTPKKLLDHLKDVAENLERVESYVNLGEEQGIIIDKRLQKSTMDIFAAILNLCQLYTQAAKESGTAVGFGKNVLRAAIRWDGGLSKTLEAIKQATDREAKNNIAQLRVSDISNHGKIDRNVNLERLRKYLSLDGKNFEWVGFQKSLEEERITGIGDWILEQNNFKSWVDTHRYSESPVLYIKAGSGHGKSHLCSRIIRFLEEGRERSKQKNRVSVAWYFIPKGQASQNKSKQNDTQEKKKTTRKNKAKRLTLLEAIQALVWQLAESDPAFLTFLVNSFEKDPSGFSSARDMWDSSILRFYRSSRKTSDEPGKVLFLILDGYDAFSGDEKHAFQSMLNTLASQRESRIQVRILLSSNEDPPEVSRNRAKFISKIEPLDDDKRSDAETFLKDYLGDLEQEWDKKSEGHRVFWDIRTDLIHSFSGNFRDLEESLQEVERSRPKGLTELQNLTKGRLRDPGLMIERKLNRLNIDLGSNDIEVLNEIIICTVHWRVWPAVDQLNAYLSMQLQNKFEGPFEERMVERLAGIVDVDDDVVYANRLMDFVEEQKVWESTTTGHDRRICGQQNIHHEDFIIPKYLFEHICTENGNSDLSEGIRKHLLDKHMISRPTVSFNQENGVLHTAQFLLRSICENNYRNRADSKYIFEYAAVWLPRHLNDLNDLGEHLNNLQDWKEEMGRWLCRAFTEKELVEAWLPLGDIDDMLFYEWLENFDGLHTLLQDKCIKKGFMGKKDDLKKESVVEEDVGLLLSEKILYQLLEEPAKVVASQWLQEGRWGALKSLKFLIKIFLRMLSLKEKQSSWEHPKIDRRLFQALKGLKLEDDQEQFGGESLRKEKQDEDADISKSLGTIHPEQYNISLEAVKVAEDWALHILGIPTAQSRRNTTHDVRVAETYMDLGEHGFQDAQRRCEFVINREPLDVKATLCLSRVLGRKENRRSRALEELMKIRHIVQSPDYRTDHPEAWKEELERFWALCDNTNSVKEALTVCSELAEKFPKETFPSEKALRWIIRQTKLDSSFEILSIRRSPEGPSMLAELFCSNARSDDFHRKFHGAAKDRPDLVFKTYKDAMKICRIQIDTAFLRYHYGMALYRSGRRDEALDTWKQSVNLFKADGAWNDESQTLSKSFNRVAERLFSAYYEIVLATKSTEYIRKLEEHKSHFDKQPSVEVNYLSLLLGRAYHITGREQKAVMSVRSHLERAFNLLSDDTENNDWNGYFMLAEALTSLVDDENALAAWSLVADVLESDPDCLSIPCAGNCSWSWAGSKDLQRDLYICRDCPHVYFERSCYERLHKGNLDQLVCSQSHKFLKVSKSRASGLSRLKPNHVLVGKNETWIDDWLQGLRCRYGLPNPALSRMERAVEASAIVKWKLRRQTATAIGAIRALSSAKRSV